MTTDTAEVELIRRSIEEAVASGSDAVGALMELGWADLFEQDPALATAEVFEAQGRLLAGTTALDLIVVAALHAPWSARLAVVHPLPGSSASVPGRRDHSGDIEYSGLVTLGVRQVDCLLVPVSGFDGSLQTFVADVADAETRVVQGLDPAMCLMTVSGRIVQSGEEAAFEETGTTWESVASAARRALAHEICGTAQAMLDEAASYVTGRRQFDRPIASFQSVRHHLSDVFVALCAARAVLEASWIDPDPLIADAAKALAGQAGALASESCLQVTGAIGFTEEYGLARRIRRLHVLDWLYGSSSDLRARIGNRLLDDGVVPRLCGP